ncbi:MAG: hypothetical protein BMS9Abin15_0219 [Gammaproteobacteria bacterium]|nr:MAG: hypothetical protein BMS9Abin15_0219 [Gammaproteobacteria bacterium]
MVQSDELKALEVDEDGFLKDPHHWREAIAAWLTKEDGVGRLQDAHWMVLRYLRGHYLRHGTLSCMAHVCHVNHRDKHGALSDTLFHGSREVWRRLTNPGEEAKTCMR